MEVDNSADAGTDITDNSNNNNNPPSTRNSTVMNSNTTDDRTNNNGSHIISENMVATTGGTSTNTNTDTDPPTNTDIIPPSNAEASSAGMSIGTEDNNGSTTNAGGTGNDDSLTQTVEEQTQQGEQVDFDFNIIKDDEDEQQDDSSYFLHSFRPGDHVIRWEMLPIAWPIQVHGIVLSVSETALVLVDFGLAAAPSAATNGPTTPKTTHNNSTEDVTENNSSSNKSENKNEDDEAAKVAAVAAALADTTSGSGGGGVEERKEDPEEDNEEEDDEHEDEPTPTPNTAVSSSAQRRRQRWAKWFSSDPAKVEEARKEWMSQQKQDSQLSSSSLSSSSSLPSEPQPPQQQEQDQNQMLQKTFSKWNGKIMMKMKNRKRNKSKQRLNVVVLEDPKEWAKWKKVHYDKSLFGFGGGNKNNSYQNDNDNITVGENDTNSTNSATMNGETSSNAESRFKLWKKFSKDYDQNKNEKESISNQDNSSNSEKPSVENKNNVKTWWKKATARNTTVTSPETHPMDETAKSTTESPSSSYSKASMNPAMAKLLESGDKKQQGQQQEQVQPAKSRLQKLWFSSSGDDDNDDAATMSTIGDTGDNVTSSTTGSASSPKKKKANTKLDLPKDDPPKLVLARTRWLLQHGEAILPPYHAFSANSECIAVFCKTGYWRNLQADVFLHSTAIGNAKTMGVATMGVAASVPLLAPVVAGLGLGLVAAPWYVLHSAKTKADRITQSMNDAFWAQADAEVFIECIEHWSKIDDYYKLKATTTAEKQEQEWQQEEELNKKTDNMRIQSSTEDQRIMPSQTTKAQKIVSL